MSAETQQFDQETKLLISSLRQSAEGVIELPSTREPFNVQSIPVITPVRFTIGVFKHFGAIEEDQSEFAWDVLKPQYDQFADLGPQEQKACLDFLGSRAVAYFNVLNDRFNRSEVTEWNKKWSDLRRFAAYAINANSPEVYEIVTPQAEEDGQIARPASGF